MSLDQLVGATFGPIPMRISPEKTAEYVAATRADPSRWIDHAPPSYAGALLFVVAPEFLSRDDVVEHTRVLIHADQQFAWYAPLPIGGEIEVAGSIARVRARGAISFVSFEATVTGPDGPLIDSTSTFLLGREPAAEPGDRSEPAVDAGVGWEPVVSGSAADDGVAVVRGASRADLVKYAAASGDFNPIHFDHDAARGAGVDGIVVHGLLMTAWMLDYAAATSGRPDPVATAKIRYRDPLYPAERALLSGSLREATADEGRLDLELAAGERRLVTAQATVRR